MGTKTARTILLWVGLAIIAIATSCLIGALLTLE